MHVLSISSLKGGVGKTTVTLGMTSAAFARGLRTLVVDLDPQSDVSTGMDISVQGHLNIADVLASPKEKIVRAAISPSGWTRGRPGKIDVLIGSPSAINFDGPHPSIRDIWKLEEALAHLEGDYDLVLIDSAPSLNALTRTAWAASDRVAIVTEPGLFSVAAADRALRAIEEIRRGLSPRLQPLGIIVNRAKIQSLEHQFRIKELRDMFGPLVLSPQLPERTSLQQAQGAAKPLHVWPGEGAQEMAHYFDQLLERVIRAGRIPVGGVPFESEPEPEPTESQAPQERPQAHGQPETEANRQPQTAPQSYPKQHQPHQQQQDPAQESAEQPPQAEPQHPQPQVQPHVPEAPQRQYLRPRDQQQPPAAPAPTQQQSEHDAPQPLATEATNTGPTQTEPSNTESMNNPFSFLVDPNSDESGN